MKVIKIKKNFRNGIVEHYIPLTDDSLTEDDINDIVSEWAENDYRGYYNGYTVRWEESLDVEKNKEVVLKKQKELEHKIETMSDEINLLKNYFNSL